MTTVVIDKTSIAADSQFSYIGLCTKGDKLFEVGDDIIGFSGPVESGLAFVEWKKGALEKPLELDDDFEALVLSKGGKMVYYGSKMIPIPIKEKFSAIGSGSHLAIGAMHAGLSPEDAVKIACKVDIGSCLPVKVFNLKRGKK